MAGMVLIVNWYYIWHYYRWMSLKEQHQYANWRPCCFLLVRSVGRLGIHAPASLDSTPTLTPTPTLPTLLQICCCHVGSQKAKPCWWKSIGNINWNQQYWWCVYTQKEVYMCGMAGVVLNWYYVWHYHRRMWWNEQCQWCQLTLYVSFLWDLLEDWIFTH
jgi:hypothetical protein